MFKLPYIANQITVTSDMCDHNDHMNVNYYYKMFDEVYSKLYFEELDFSPEYVASGFSTFTLEDNIRYLKEFRLGDKIYPSFLLTNANENMLGDGIRPLCSRNRCKDSYQTNDGAKFRLNTESKTNSAGRSWV